MGTSAARGLTNMAVGKNKRLTKGKKGSKKKIIDPFASKDWYDIKAPSVFTNPICGKTLASRTKGTKLSSDALKGRVCEVSLGDLKQNEDDAYRKIRLRIEDVQGKQVLCNFWGMDFTTDKLRSLVRKWQSLIESNVDVKTTGGYVLRCFCIGFTKKRQFQIRKTCYSQEDGGHHDQGSGLVRPDQGCGEVRAGVHWQGHYEGLRGYLPAPECVHP